MICSNYSAIVHRTQMTQMNMMDADNYKHSEKNHV